ncbi:MAG: amidohydrolase family protein [Woeseiaceae bacterium]|nr:amidohydrolase family protein [Woeseiaceae bacterium]
MNRILLTALVVLICSLPATLQAATTAITGARVHTVGPQGTLENATVLIEDGRIVAVGTDVDVPGAATRIDASGKIVTPGLFTPLGQLGLTEVSAVSGTVDYIQRGHDFTAGFDVAAAYNPRSTLIAVNRIEGITRAAITPGGAWPDMQQQLVSHVLSGLGAIVQLGAVEDNEDALVRRRAMLVVNLGEDGGVLAGGSRAAAMMTLRTALDDALDYAGNKDAYESRERREYSLSRTDLEAMQDVIEGSVPLLVYVDRASDIRALLDLTGEYSLPLIIAGGAEAWMVADELAEHDVGVILSSVNNLPGTFDELNARLDAAALLDAAGVAVTFGGDRNAQNHNARNITQSAGIAVANGLTWETALRAITLTPAELYGVADQVGSLEAGKDADIVIWKNDPLELTSYPEQVFIRGYPVPMESRQTLLRDRYMQTDAERPPAFRHPECTTRHAIDGGQMRFYDELFSDLLKQRPDRQVPVHPVARVPNA